MGESIKFLNPCSQVEWEGDFDWSIGFDPVDSNHPLFPSLREFCQVHTPQIGSVPLLNPPLRRPKRGKRKQKMVPSKKLWSWGLAYHLSQDTSKSKPSPCLAWVRVTCDSWVLKTVQFGYCLYFESPPPSLVVVLRDLNVFLKAVKFRMVSAAPVLQLFKIQFMVYCPWFKGCLFSQIRSPRFLQIFVFLLQRPDVSVHSPPFELAMPQGILKTYYSCGGIFLLKGCNIFLYLADWLIVADTREDLLQHCAVHRVCTGFSLREGVSVPPKQSPNHFVLGQYL